MNKKISSILSQKAIFYLLTILVLDLIIAIYDWRVAIPGLVLLLCLAVYNIVSNFKRKKELTKYIETLTLNVESASKDTVLNFPLPLIVVELDGTIVWYNSLSKGVFGDSKLFEKNIDSLVKGLNPNELVSEKIISRTAQINFRHYRVIGNFMKTAAAVEKTDYVLLLYFIDISEQVKLKEKYDNEKMVAGLVVIDNYEELMQSVEDTMRPQVLAEIDKKITGWMGFTEGIIKKFERDRYLFLFEFRYLNDFKKAKFEILDEVKNIKYGMIPVTLSIGFGINGNDLEENLKYAEASIDLALARGGDQVVVKDRESLSFFGGRTKEIEKRTKVKARVIAYALRELIDQAERVMIMGHENGDMDSMGASLGIYRLVKSRGKEANIVLGKPNPNISRLIDKLRENCEYDGLFIKEGDAVDYMSEKTLLIVVDTHRPSFTESPRLLENASQVVVLDHHRRGAEFIEDPVLIYQEAYASSTSELVAEIMQYADENLKLTPEEAEALYAGIVLDTNNFTFKTGVRTFEAASYLRKKGVDTGAIKYLMQNDLKTYSAVSDVVRSAHIIEGNIAVAAVPEDEKNQNLIAAKAADELLMLSDISASFVLCRQDSDIAISGRSLGEFNVQAVLEQLGGGGHMTVAGAQLSGVAMEEAVKQLEYVIIKYVKQYESDGKKIN